MAYMGGDETISSHVLLSTYISVLQVKTVLDKLLTYQACMSVGTHVSTVDSLLTHSPRDRPSGMGYQRVCVVR